MFNRDFYRLLADPLFAITFFIRSIASEIFLKIIGKNDIIIYTLAAKNMAYPELSSISF